VTVEVAGGQVTRVALDPEWLLEAGDDLLAATVAAAATRAVRDYLANQLEAQISGGRRRPRRVRFRDFGGP
jgi:DNA-binding protein YbaB